MSADPATDPLENEDLVESKVEDFIKMRLSQMTQQEMRLAASLIGTRPAGKVEEDVIDKERDIFRIHRKEDDYFEKLSDLEQVRLYTSLHDHNQRLRDSIGKLKKQFISLLQSRDGVDKLDMQELTLENRALREELRQLTLQQDSVPQALLRLLTPSTPYLLSKSSC